MDRCQCPPALIRDWLSDAQHPNLVFRVAVREVEAWLLAHQSALAPFLGTPEIDSRRCGQPGRSKTDLDRLGSKIQVPRSTRRHCAPPCTARIGPDYNRRLSTFARKHWDARLAARFSASLQRARESSPRLDRHGPGLDGRPTPHEGPRRFTIPLVGAVVDGLRAGQHHAVERRGFQAARQPVQDAAFRKEQLSVPRYATLFRRQHSG